VNTTVSVIMPTYQRAAVIARSIESVFAQRGIPGVRIELVVVDDGSTDGTATVVEEVIPPEPHSLKYIGLSHRGKPGLVRNDAFAHCTGQFIGYCDSDDIWLPHHLATCLSQFKTHPNLVMVETWWSFQTGEPTGTGVQFNFTPRWTDGRTTNTNCRLHLRSVVDQIGGFNSSEWGEDSDYWNRIAFQGPVRRIKIPTTANSYIRGGNHITFRYEPNIALEYGSQIWRHLHWFGVRLKLGIRHPTWLARAIVRKLRNALSRPSAQQHREANLP